MKLDEFLLASASVNHLDPNLFPWDEAFIKDELWLGTVPAKAVVVLCSNKKESENFLKKAVDQGVVLTRQHLNTVEEYDAVSFRLYTADNTFKRISYLDGSRGRTSVAIHKEWWQAAYPKAEFKFFEWKDYYEPE